MALGETDEMLRVQDPNDVDDSGTRTPVLDERHVRCHRSSSYAYTLRTYQVLLCWALCLQLESGMCLVLGLRGVSMDGVVNVAVDVHNLKISLPSSRTMGLLFTWYSIIDF